MITYDPRKRHACLVDRQLDFARANEVFADPDVVFAPDLRVAYCEPRYISAGLLDGRMVVVVWTPRGEDQHIISMKHCHAKEVRAIKDGKGRYKDRLG